MNESNKTITIDGYKMLIEYGSPELKHEGRISTTDHIGDGNKHIHIPGKSANYEIKFTIYIEQEDTDQLEHFHTVVYDNLKVSLVSTFNMIPSGTYFLKGFSPKYYDSRYYSVDMELILVNSDDYISNLTSTDLNNGLTTASALTTDTNSFTSTNIELVEGYNNKAQVRQIQLLLRQNGFYLDKLVDGIWGASLTLAIQEYQQKKGIDVTGTMNEKTKQLLGYGR